MHEAAHEWWGNNVTYWDIADMWIHESFGAYAEALFVEHHYGRAESLNYINAKKRNVRNDRPLIGEYNLHRSGSRDMYDKGQLVLNTLRSVLNDDELWISILRGIQETFHHQTVSSDQIFRYINARAGQDLSYFFDQYFRHARIPTLMVQVEGDGASSVLRYRWDSDVTAFRMPIRVTTRANAYEFITPTAQWQMIALDGMNPHEFRVAEDLYYVNVRRE